MKSQVKTRIRVGRIQYTNTLPFFHKLETSPAIEAHYYAAYPSRINLALRKGKIDIAPVSSLEYLNHHEQYYVLPDMGIGARDFSGSVILFSKERIENLNGRTIALTRQSLSSSVLLRILLKFKYKYENKFQLFNSELDTILKTCPAALVIGDQALLHRSADFVYKYDLSELWWDWTEKPFCFSLWAVRKAFADENPEVVRTFYHDLKNNLSRNLEDLELLIKESRQLGFLDKDFSRIFGYLFNLNYGLDEHMREGLDLFYRMAHRLKFSPKIKKMEFFLVD